MGGSLHTKVLCIEIDIKNIIIFFMKFKDIVLNKMNSASNLKVVKLDRNNVHIRPIKGSTNITKIPLKITTDLAFFIGIVMGDGHITKRKYRISLDTTKPDFARKFSRLLNKTFDINVRYILILDKRKNRKLRYRFDINNKPICLILTDIFKIPKGKKSHIITIHPMIKNSRSKIKMAFLRGVIDTEGGKRKKIYTRISTASKGFRDDLTAILKDLNVNVHIDQWVNKKYQKEYYGLYFKTSELRESPSQV